MMLPERYSAAGKLTRGILDSIGADNPMQLSGEEFGQAAEGYYRRQLRTAYVREALGCVREDLQPIDGGGSDGDRRDRGLATAVIGPRRVVNVARCRSVMNSRAANDRCEGGMATDRVCHQPGPQASTPSRWRRNPWAGASTGRANPTSPSAAPLTTIPSPSAASHHAGGCTWITAGNPASDRTRTR